MPSYLSNGYTLSGLLASLGHRVVVTQMYCVDVTYTTTRRTNMNTDNMTKKQLQALVEKLSADAITTGRMVMLTAKSGDKYNAYISLSVNEEQLKSLQVDMNDSDTGHAQLEVALSQSLERFWVVDPATGKPAPTYFTTTKSDLGGMVSYKEYMAKNPKSKKYRLAG